MTFEIKDEADVEVQDEPEPEEEVVIDPTEEEIYSETMEALEAQREEIAQEEALAAEQAEQAEQAEEPAEEPQEPVSRPQARLLLIGAAYQGPRPVVALETLLAGWRTESYWQSDAWDRRTAAASIADQFWSMVPEGGVLTATGDDYEAKMLLEALAGTPGVEVVRAYK